MAIVSITIVDTLPFKIEIVNATSHYTFTFDPHCIQYWGSIKLPMTICMYLLNFFITWNTPDLDRLSPGSVLRLDGRPPCSTQALQPACGATFSAEGSAANCCIVVCAQYLSSPSIHTDSRSEVWAINLPQWCW